MTNIDIEHEPPTSEEMLAYLRGGLTAEQEASFRSRLIHYPELLRTLVAPFPEPAQPGDEDYLSDHEFARRWADFQKRIEPPKAKPAFWPAVAAFAASVAIIFGSMYWKGQSDQRLPQVLSVEPQPLYPDGNSRGAGGSAVTITPADDWYSLVPVLMDERSFESYRVELFDERVRPARSLWSRRGVARTSEATLVVLVPRSFLAPGFYRLSVFGNRGGEQEHVNDYTFRVAP